MKQPEQYRKILLAYLNTPSQEVFKRKMEMDYPQLDNLQFEILSEQLLQYSSFSKQHEILFLFPYILNNIRFFNSELNHKRTVGLLWERGFDNNVGTIEKLEQMYKSWMALEKKLTEIEKEHSINKEPEHERH